MVVLAAISVGRSECAGRFDGGGDRFGVMAVDMRACPSRQRRSAPPGRSKSASDTAPSMEMWLLSQKTISLFSLRWPASVIASWRNAFHQAAVAGQHIGVVVDEVVAEGGVQDALGERHADAVGEALAERAGGRLDAGGVAVFGMAGGVRAELAEMLDLVDRDVGDSRSDRAANRAASSRGRPTARSGRGPASADPSRSNFRKRVNSTVAMSAAAHRQAGMAGIGLLDRIHGKEADGVGHPVMFFALGHGSLAVWRVRAMPVRKARDT